jgi:putative FmdB family regulatory protein
MPIYEYRCKKGHTFEVLQRMADDPLDECTTCGAPVQRVFHPVAVHFKGSGFYTTDYGKKKSAAAKDGKPDTSPDSGSESSKDSKDGAKKEKKADKSSSASSS